MWRTPKSGTLAHLSFCASEHISSYLVKLIYLTLSTSQTKLYLDPFSLHSSCFSFHVLFCSSMDFSLSPRLPNEQLRPHSPLTVHTHSITKSYWVSSPNTVINYPLPSIPPAISVAHLCAGLDFCDNLPTCSFSDSGCITLGFTDPKVSVDRIHELCWKKNYVFIFTNLCLKVRISFLWI